LPSILDDWTLDSAICAPLGHPSIKIDDTSGIGRAELRGCQSFGALIGINDRLAYDKRFSRLF
jgi:hypothetical protein